MYRFENDIFKQKDEINNRMTEMFGLLKELMTSRAPEKVLMREEAKHPVTENINYISLIKGEEEKNDNDNTPTGDSIEKPDGSDAWLPLKEAEKDNEAKNETKSEPIKSAEKELTQSKEKEAVEVPSSQPIGYYLKHRINEKLIEGLVENHRFNDSLSAARVGKMKQKTYNLLPRRKLTDERPAEIDIRLSLASHSYIYPLGIAEDVLVDVVGYVYPVDFVILDIKEDEKRPFILGTPFLTTAEAVIKFDKGTVTLRSKRASLGMGGKDKTSPRKGDGV
ncbi:MAK10-like protein [Tanacetum coccineum]